MGRCLRKNRVAATLAMKATQTGIEEFDMVCQLCHGPHRGAGSANRIFSVDGNGGRNVFDAIHPGAIHSVHELPGIGGKGFDIAALALGVKGVKSKGGFSGAADTGHHCYLVEGYIEVQVLQVVLAGSGYPDRLWKWVLFFCHVVLW